MSSMCHQSEARRASCVKMMRLFPKAGSSRRLGPSRTRSSCAATVRKVNVCLGRAPGACNHCDGRDFTMLYLGFNVFLRISPTTYHFDRFFLQPFTRPRSQDDGQRKTPPAVKFLDSMPDNYEMSEQEYIRLVWLVCSHRLHVLL